MPGASGVDDALVAEVAHRAVADPRSVVRRFAGLPVKGRSGERIDAAMAALGVRERVLVVVTKGEEK